ncbi:MAG: type II secretion system F family protein [Parvibaculaceae bacterium]
MTKQFRYSAFSPDGGVVHGTVEASSQADALRLVRDKGILPFETQEVSAAYATGGRSFVSLWSSSLGLAARAALVRELATLIRADVNIDHALRILVESASSGEGRKLLLLLVERVTAGQSLSAALAASANGFRRDEIAMIKAGEQTGSLAGVLAQLAGFLERRVELRHKLVSALVYPALLLVMAAISIFIIVTVLIPNIMPLFEGTGMKLPVIISVLMGAIDFTKAYWLLILVAVITAAALLAYTLRQEGARLALDRLFLRLPFLGTHIRKAALGAVCRTIATLLQSGVHLQQAMAACVEVVGNRIAKAEVQAAREQVIHGKRLSQSLRAGSIFDPAAARILALGEETNRLSEMLLHIADKSEADVARSTERWMAMLTPVMTLVLGLLIGGLIMSVMQAILSVNEIAVR